MKVCLDSRLTRNLKSLIRATPSAKYDVLPDGGASGFPSFLQSVENKNLEDVRITNIVSDSRKVRKGNLFVAIRGQEFDGHDFISEAVKKGAVVVVGEREVSVPNYIQVEDSRKALGLLTSAWYDFPAKKLKIIGVTGTDGKSTTVNLIYSILEAAGEEVGEISSVDAKIGEKVYETGLHTTTPNPLELWEFLALMVEKGCKYAVLEVTSHGLDQERVAGIDFEVGVLTNVTPEHLDYHQTFENYLAAKAKLLAKSKVAILNVDDGSYNQLSAAGCQESGKLITYGIKFGADARASDIKMTSSGMAFRVDGDLIESSLIGEYNVYNILAAMAAAKALGISQEAIKAGIKSFEPLTGRFEKIENEHGLNIIIDFAHTPSALEQVLRLSSKLKAQSSKLIVVFGCAGLRDRQKRPKMGKIAGHLADFVVLTAEDPRTENVNDIIEEIAQGCQKVGGIESQTFFKLPNRQEAINFAIQKLARVGDGVLLCGKGHEKSMCYGKKEYPWSEHGAVREALK